MSGTSYDFRIQATSPEGTSPWSDVLTANTTTNSVPIFDEGSSSTVTLPENSPADTPVGEFIAQDPEGREATYSIQGPDASSFTMDPMLPAVRTSSSADFDYETKNEYRFDILATDDLGQSAIHAVTVIITNVNEDPTGKPVIEGSPNVGETITVNTDAIADPDGMTNPTLFHYRWTAGGMYLPNQTKIDLELADNHFGKYIIVEVQFVDAAGFIETVYSEPFGPIDTQAPETTPTPESSATPEPTPAITPTAQPTTPIPTVQIPTPSPTMPPPTAVATKTRVPQTGGGGSAAIISATSEPDDHDHAPTPTPQPTPGATEAPTAPRTPALPPPANPRLFSPMKPTPTSTPQPSPTLTVTPEPPKPTATPWGWLPIIRDREEIPPTSALTPTPAPTPEPTTTPEPATPLPLAPKSDGFGLWWLIHPAHHRDLYRRGLHLLQTGQTASTTS